MTTGQDAYMNHVPALAREIQHLSRQRDELRAALQGAVATLLMARGLIDGAGEFNEVMSRTLDECRNALR